MTLLLPALPVEAAPASAAGDLQGLVLDAASGEGLGGVWLRVSIADRDDRLTQTDSVGAFTLSALPQGVATVQIRQLGYQPLRQEVVVDTTAVAMVTLTLHATPLVMDELLVRAQRAAERTTISGFVESIPVEQQRAPGTDLTHVLEQATSVNIRRQGGLGSFSTVSIRGSTSEQVLIYLDGVPLNRAIGGGVDLGRLPLGGIERVEVYRGAVPARFGGNSIGGVIHLRTTPLGQGRRLQVNTSSSSFGTRELGISVMGRLRQWRVLALANYASSNNDFRFWDDNGTEYNDNDNTWARRLNSDARLARLITKADRLFGQHRLRLINTFDISRKGVPGIGNNQSLQTRYNSGRHLLEATLLGPAATGRAGYRLTLYRARDMGEYKDLQGEVGVGTQHDRNTTTSIGLRGEIDAALVADGVLTLFGSGQRERFAPRDLLRDTSRLLDSRRRTVTLGTELVLPLLTRRLTLHGGAQLEHNRDRFFGRKTFAPSSLLPSRDAAETLAGRRLGFSLDLSHGWSLRGHRGRYQRAPSFFELFGDRGAVIGNSELRPEAANNTDAGLTYRAATPTSTGIQHVEIAVYDHRVEDLIRFVQNAQRVSRPHNIGNARLRGLESRLQLDLPLALEFAGSYVYQRTENRSPFLYERGNDLPNAPRHRATARLAWKLPLTGAALHYEFSHESRHYLDRANLRPVTQRDIHSVGGGMNLTSQLELSWQLRNLTDNRIADLWGYPLPGRAWSMSLRFRAESPS